VNVFRSEDDLLPEHEPLLINRTPSIQQEVTARRAQLAHTGRGRQVFFSRLRMNGEVKQVALLVSDRKYVLNRSTTGFQYIRQKRTIAGEKRTAALSQDRLPELGNANGYVVILIGWTSLMNPDIEEVAQTTLELWCRHQESQVSIRSAMPFLQDFVEGFVTQHARDWGWFHAHRDAHDIDAAIEPTRPMVAFGQDEWREIRKEEARRKQRERDNDYHWQIQHNLHPPAPAPDPPPPPDIA
jgi:hypothetical protein